MSGGWKDRLSVGYGTGISSLDQEIDISSGYRMGEAKNGVARAGQGERKKENLLAKSRTFTHKHTMKQWSPPSWFLYALFTF